MNKEKILYERTIYSSYMKIPSIEEDILDIRIMLQRRLKGMIPVERCYINGEGQFWYDITGKQALDSYIKINKLEYSIFEALILRICEQLEILEWNLLDERGLVIDPEFIFINNKGEEISFVFYPQKEKDFFKDLKQLLEYLLSKLDHTEGTIIEGAYELYELVISENCQIQDLKQIILRRRIERREENTIPSESELPKNVEKECIYDQAIASRENQFQKQLKGKCFAIYKRVKELLVRHPKEQFPTVVYPQEQEEGVMLSNNPTICIATAQGETKGIFIYEGMGDYPDFEVKQTVCIIGKSTRASFQIIRDTISEYHAKVEYTDVYYIEDLNSTNGTFVNDELLKYRERKRLNAGDLIRFADVKYRFL